jgi:hypothetical protein
MDVMSESNHPPLAAACGHWEDVGMRIGAYGLAVVVGLVIAACGTDGDDDVLVVHSPDYTLPGETLRDWVSYGDQLSVVSVLDATGPQTPPDYRGSGGLIGRRVTVRVERTLWRRRGAPRAKRTVSFDTWGWMMETDQDPNSPRRPMVSEGTTRMETGHRYLTMLVRFSDGWGPLTDRAVMTLSKQGTVTSEVVSGEPSPAAAALRGKTIARAAELVAATTPDPVADRHADLPPEKRLRAVVRASR